MYGSMVLGSEEDRESWFQGLTIVQHVQEINEFRTWMCEKHDFTTEIHPQKATKTERARKTGRGKAEQTQIAHLVTSLSVCQQYSSTQIDRHRCGVFISPTERLVTSLSVFVFPTRDQ